MNFEDTRLFNELKRRDSKYLSQVNKISLEAKHTLSKINLVFPNYTCHGIEHSICVMEYMYDIANIEGSMRTFEDLEIVVMIYAALLHDIGMVSTPNEIAEIKSNQKKVEGKRFSSVLERCNGDEGNALQEIIRPAHGKRSCEYIKDMKVDYFLLPESTAINFREEVAMITQAHNEEFSWITENLKDIKYLGNEKLNPQYIAMLLRIADYLDIDDTRAPIYLYKLISPKGYSDEEWQQHYVIDNSDKIKMNEITREKDIVFDGESRNPTIHRKVLKYIADVQVEIQRSVKYSKKFIDSKYQIRLNPLVQTRIQTKGFEVSDLKFNIEYKAIMGLLMGEKIYGDNKYGLREIIQNSIDACNVMKRKAKELDIFTYKEYEPEIQIIIDRKNEKFIIKDNGIGMTKNVINKYFLNIGLSYYNSNDYLDQGNGYNAIGNFGIGFLSCFMLSKNVIVKTKSYLDNYATAISL